MEQSEHFMLGDWVYFWVHGSRTGKISALSVYLCFQRTTVKKLFFNAVANTFSVLGMW